MATQGPRPSGMARCELDGALAITRSAWQGRGRHPTHDSASELVSRAQLPDCPA